MVKVRIRNGRGNPTEPGNDAVLYNKSSERIALGRETRRYYPRKERLGRLLARVGMFSVLGLHGVLFPLLSIAHFIAPQWVDAYLSEWVFGTTIAVGVFVMVIRLVANGLTRKEEHVSWRMIQFYFIGLLVHLLIGVLLNVIR